MNWFQPNNVDGNEANDHIHLANTMPNDSSIRQLTAQHVNGVKIENKNKIQPKKKWLQKKSYLLYL